MKTKKILLATIIATLLLSMIPITTSTSAPSVSTTLPVTGIETNNATIHGLITDDGGEENTVGFEYGLTASYGTNVSPPPTYLYAGGTVVCKVFQYYNDLTKKTESAQYGVDSITSLTQDKTYIYAGIQSAYKVYQIWKSNMTKKAETASYGDDITCVAQDYLYVYAGGYSTDKVYKYWKSNMTKKSQTLSYGGNIMSLTIDDTYIYAGGDTTNKVYKYWKSNMTKKAETASYGGSIYALAQDNNNIYAGGMTTNTVKEYLKSTMAYVGQTASYGGGINAISDDSTYLYAGGSTTKTVRQYWKTNLTMKAESANYGGVIKSLIEDSEYVYAGGLTTKTVRQYWKTNLTMKAESANYGGGINAILLSDTYVTGDTFSYDLTGLSPGTTYHYRAFANNSIGQTEGSDDDFTTLTAFTPPTVTTDGANDITPNDEQLVGTLTDDGGQTCSVWFEYGTTPSYGSVSAIQPGLTTGDTVYITIGSLSNNTLYHYRAFANNTLGISSGTDETFTTTDYYSPTVTTIAPATGISNFNATLPGYLDDDGYLPCTVWFQYGTTTAYGSTTTHQTASSGDSFYANINSLSFNTTYHYRAVVHNSKGTSYGTDETFMTNHTHLNVNWTGIFDGIGRMFTGGNYTDSNGIYHSVTGIFGGGQDTRSLLGVFIFAILFLLTAIWGLGILIGSVAIIPSVFAVMGYVPELAIIVAIVAGLAFGLGLNRIIRR